jgi:hypothetical protein
LRRRLTPLGDVDDASDLLLSSITVAPETFPAGDDEGREQRPLSPERQHYLKLQGEYVGHLRRLDPRHKEQVKRLRARDGIQAAVALAKKLRGA